MHVLFIHPGFPGQFGALAHYLSRRPDWQCTYACSVDTSHRNLPFTHINYRVQPGPLPKNFRNPFNYQGMLEHMNGLYAALRAAPEIKPDLVVGHLGYSTLLHLRTLYRCPFIGYYEWLPPPFWNERLAFRPEYPPTEELRLRDPTCHIFNLLQLHAVDAAYTPTYFQRTTAPGALQPKIRVLFDGIDTELFQRQPLPRPFTFRGLTLPPEARVVTYVSRGLGSVRGFDIFMKAAKRIAAAVPNVHFIIVGGDHCNYGHEHYHIRNQTFKDYVISLDDYDLTNFHFVGLVPLRDLATLFSLSDLHIYLTAPFVLSWSLVQAMSSGCTLLCSATPPVQEPIDHGVHGLLVEFYDHEGLAQRAVEVLRDPEAYRGLGAAARARVLERYANEVCLPKHEAFFREVLARARAPRKIDGGISEPRS